MSNYSYLYSLSNAELLELEQQCIYIQDTETLRKIATVKKFPKRVTKRVHASTLTSEQLANSPWILLK